MNLPLRVHPSFWQLKFKRSRQPRHLRGLTFTLRHLYQCKAQYSGQYLGHKRSFSTEFMSTGRLALFVVTHHLTPSTVEISPVLIFLIRTGFCLKPCLRLVDIIFTIRAFYFLRFTHYFSSYYFSCLQELKEPV